jgi:hypothetical protein
MHGSWLIALTATKKTGQFGTSAVSAALKSARSMPRESSLCEAASPVLPPGIDPARDSCRHCRADVQVAKVADGLDGVCFMSITV